MSIRRWQSGFAVLETVLVLIIIAVVVIIGLWVYHGHKTKPVASTTTPAAATQSPVANNVSDAPAINSTSDLDKALNTLNQNDPSTANNSDSSQLDSQTNF